MDSGWYKFTWSFKLDGEDVDVREVSEEFTSRVSELDVGVDMVVSSSSPEFPLIFVRFDGFDEEVRGDITVDDKSLVVDCEVSVEIPDALLESPQELQKAMTQVKECNDSVCQVLREVYEERGVECQLLSELREERRE